MGISWNSAVEGTSGLWYKSGVDDDGQCHLLVAENRRGVEVNGGSHDHYWKRDGSYYVQLRDRSGTALAAGKKGHIFERDTKFSGIDKYLDGLFSRYCSC
ncbi:MAG: hypothetical protein HQL76_01035 [Magnetococcales bacterium]|nr:hypothetical protein [Magnetococcales bacterium]